jgi:hypothetical protein
MGVPDFVYLPKRVSKGAAQRELSDGLLVAGDRACILQVKSRAYDEGWSEDAAAAERWVMKHSEKARNQGLGTRRHLASNSAEFTSLRGYERHLQLPPSTPIVVILDHPRQPEIKLPVHDDTVFISLSDWLGLQFMIRSTAGVIDYVSRVLEAKVTLPLGRESERYAVFAGADDEWAGQSPTAVPQLPPRVLSDEEAFRAAFYDDLIDRVADSRSRRWDPQEYLHIVEHLDRVPTLARVKIGKKMIATFNAMVEAKSRRSFINADVDGHSRLAVLYDYTEDHVDDDELERFMARIAIYGVLRHHQAREAGASLDGATLAVGILHHPLEGRASAFAFCKGSIPSLPEDLRRGLEDEFGVFNGTTILPPPGRRL